MSAVLQSPAANPHRRTPDEMLETARHLRAFLVSANELSYVEHDMCVLLVERAERLSKTLFDALDAYDFPKEETQ